MKKIIIFSLFIFTLILTRLLDIYVTYLYSNNLEKEANPLVTIFGFGWAGIIIVQFVIVTTVTYFFYNYIFNNVRNYEFKANSFNNFCAMYFYSKDMKMNKFVLYSLYKLPNWAAFKLLLGFSLIKTLIIIGVFAIFSWVMIETFESEWFIVFYNILFPYHYLIILFFSYYIFMFQFLYKEYKLYLVR